MNYQDYFTLKDGHLIWKCRPRNLFKSNRSWNSWNAKYSGRRAGYNETDRRTRRVAEFVTFNSNRMATHRIIFAMTNGYEPPMVDHKDGDTLNNRPENLRRATDSQNQANRKPKGGRAIKGVTYRRAKGKWEAAIRVNGLDHYLGIHPTKGLAAVAYAKAALRHHGQFARTHA